MTSRTFPLSRQRRRRTTPEQTNQADPPIAEGTVALSPSPRLPHEHDEHTDEPHAPRAPMIQAEADLAQGQQDTDRRGDAARVFEEAARRGRHR